MKAVLSVVTLGLVLSGCAPTTKYEWGAYPHAMLAYYRAPAERLAFDQAIDEAVSKGEATHRVPPGLYAEAGYEALSQGQLQKAKDSFNREKAAWPESAAFMDKAIAGVNKTSSGAAAASATLAPSS